MVTEQKTPVAEEVATGGAAYATRQMPAAAPASGSNAALKNFDSLMASFQQKKQQEEQEKANRPQVEEARDELDQQAMLDRAVIDAAIARWAEELKSVNRITLATSLSQAAIDLKFNKLTFSLGTDMERSMMERDRTEIAEQLRLKSGYPSLFIEIVVDPSLIPLREDKPYTLEDKLRVLSEKNPAMKRLQETFRTRILQ